MKERIVVWGTYGFYILIFVFAIIASFLEELDIDFSELNTPLDYAKITDIDYSAQIDDDADHPGSALITEKLTFDVHALTKSNGFKELYRDLVEDTVDGLKVNYDVVSVYQILPDGTKKEYLESPKLYWYDSDYNTPYRWFHSPGPYNERLKQYECVLFYIPNVYRETMTFELTYYMNNAVLKYNDCSDLYISMFSDDCVYDLNSFKANISILDSKMPKEGNYTFYTYGTSNVGFDYTESDNVKNGYHTFSIDLDKKDLVFDNENDYLEFELIEYNKDKNTFSKTANTNKYTYTNVLADIKEERQEYLDENEELKATKISINIILALMSLGIILITYSIDKYIKSHYNFYKPEIDYDYFREIPEPLDPYFAARFAFCKSKMPKKIQEDYSCLLLSLVRKKYVSVRKLFEEKPWSEANTKITIIYFPSVIFTELPETNDILKHEPLTTNEYRFFNLIRRYATGITYSLTLDFLLTQIERDYDNTEAFVKNVNNSIKDIGITKNYFQTADYNSAKKTCLFIANFYKIFGIIMLFIGACAYLTKYTTKITDYFMLILTIIIAFICSNFAKKKSNQYILLSQEGENEYAKWKGLYNFLNSDTLLSEKEIPDLVLWEQYLVYATAFGISDKILNALKIRNLDVNIPDYSVLNSNSYFRTSHFHSYSHTFNHGIRSTAHSASAIRAGGGYRGGGGRGGGGGRRRSLNRKN